MAFKDYLKKYRIDAGLTQKELAKRSGVSYSYLTKLESGEQINPTYEILESLGKVLGAPLGAVYDFDDSFEDKNVSAAIKIGRAYEKAPPPVQRTVEVALEPYMVKDGDSHAET